MPIQYSEKFIEKMKQITSEVFYTLGLRKSTIIYYSFKPFIIKDIRSAFKQPLESDQVLKDYYAPFWASGKNFKEQVANIAKAVNKRLNYGYDQENWGATEYWATPIETHNKMRDDCNGYSLLITYILRLMGLSEYEVFTSVGYVITPKGKEYHAYTLVFDWDTLQFFPLEGSFYAEESINKWMKGLIDIGSNLRYETPDWITNDKISFSNTGGLIKFISKKK